jgi:hypothetical protein
MAAVLVLYITIITIDTVRKMAGVTGSIIGMVYIVTSVIYIIIGTGSSGTRTQITPRHLPLLLLMLSLWSLIEAVVQRVPPAMALVGWMSYVFFVPLFYVGAELMADDRRAARTLQLVSFAGSIIGFGAIASTMLGQSAPSFLQPIIPSAGVHSSAEGNIYLAPSIFATAEEASEHLLIALFCWTALRFLPSNKPKRSVSALQGLLIIGGLIATERRADIYVAVIGLLALFSLRHAPLRLVADRTLHPSNATVRNSVGSALILIALGSLIFISVLGTSKVASFLISGSPESRISLMFSPSNPTSLAGQGPGTSTQGASLVGAVPFNAYNSQGPYSAQILNGRTFITVEGGLAKTWLELGIVGVLLYGAVFFSVLAAPVRHLLRLDVIGRALTILSIALGVIFLKGHQSLDDLLVQPIYWLAAGGIWGRMRADAAEPRCEAATRLLSTPAADYRGVPTDEPNFML